MQALSFGQARRGVPTPANRDVVVDVLILKNVDCLLTPSCWRRELHRDSLSPASGSGWELKDWRFFRRGNWDGEVFAFVGGGVHDPAASMIRQAREDHSRGLDPVEKESGASAIDSVLGDRVEDFLERDHQGVGVFDERHEDVGVLGLLGRRRGSAGATRAGRVVPVAEVGIAQCG
jgi:hypothetical protein